MYMRLVQMQVKKDSIDKLSKRYTEEVIPRLGRTDGCRFAGLVQSAGSLDECMSLTLWESASAAEAYVESGTYAELLDSLSPYLAETSEWKVKLTEDQRIEYVPVAEEPAVKAYNVTLAQGDPGMAAANPAALYVRVLSVRLKPDGMEEFRKIYEREILPALYETSGCRYAYLTEDAAKPDEALSLTVWNRKEDADEYERSGRFGLLVKKISHLLAGLYQWKMSLGKETGRSAVTSEDMTKEGYQIIIGRSFVS
jgi:quinol monooxygenase YgiN